MPSLLYPESAWPARFGRFVRALQIVAIAGTIGAVGGGAAVLAVMGSGPPHKLAIVGADDDDAAKAVNATKAVGDAQASPQSSRPAVASPAPAAASPAPVAAPPASGTAQPAQLAAAAAEPAAAAPQNTGPAAAPAASEIDSRVKSAERVHSRSAKLRARENRRQRSVASRYAQQRDWHAYDQYQQSEGGSPQRGFDSGASQRRVQTGANGRGGYSYYDSAARNGYWGGGPMFGGNWGNGSWGN